MRKRITINILFLAAIFLAGVFLRTYHFHDFLRFNPDQARDAAIIREIIENGRPLPLLGPKAGGTEFRLGPAFYYFQFLSAKIFGAAPDRMAYPDLFFAVLSIPLLYILLRKYFSVNISLVLTGLFSLSYYAVKYSRFAWNPNSTPFYAMLFLLALYKLGEAKKKWPWAILVGVSMGIGIQLHSLLLLAFPIVTASYFAYLFFQKNPAWKKIWVVAAIVLTLNIPQFVNEFVSLEKNSRAFILAYDNKSSRKADLFEKLEMSLACQVQADGLIVSSFGDDDKCNFLDIISKLQSINKFQNLLANHPEVLINMILCLIFTLGGYWLLIKFWKKEKELGKKNFLALLLLYAGINTIILIPLGLEISMRFYLGMVFLPFVFGGLWILFLSKRFKKKGIVIIFAFAILTAVLNLASIKEKFSNLKGGGQEQEFNEITLGEVEFIANYMAGKSASAKTVYLEGNKVMLFEIFKPIKYFTDKKGMTLLEFDEKQPIDAAAKYFSVDVNKTGEKTVNDGFKIAEQAKFGRIRIFEIRPK